MKVDCSQAINKYLHVFRNNIDGSKHFIPIQKTLDLINFDSIRWISIESDQNPIGFALLSSYPNSWDINLFHFIDNSAFESGLPVLLQKIQGLFEEQKNNRTFVPSLLKIKFPLALHDPRWSKILFLQKGYNSIKRMEQKVKIDTCLDRINKRLSKFSNNEESNNKDIDSTIRFINFKPELFGEFVKIGHAVIKDTLEEKLYFSDYFSIYDSYQNNFRNLISGEQGFFLPQYSFLAYKHNLLVGLSLCIEHQNHLYITEIGVLPQFRSQGITSNILKKICHKAHNVGYDELYVCSLEENIPANNLYRHLGFKEVKHQLWYLLNMK